MRCGHWSSAQQDGAFAQYKRFAAGGTLAEAEFISAEHLNRRRGSRANG
ncbi:hypothetical protein HMPREF1546_01699, partial [Oscillibacter sp. KLE 1745]